MEVGNFRVIEAFQAPTVSVEGLAHLEYQVRRVLQVLAVPDRRVTVVCLDRLECLVGLETKEVPASLVCIDYYYYYYYYYKMY